MGEENLDNISVIILGPAGMSCVDYLVYFCFFVSVFIIIFTVGFIIGRYFKEKEK